MDLSSLAAKQQRIKTWLHFIDTQVQSDQLRQAMSETLERYRSVIARCWKSEIITAQDQQDIGNLERELEEFDEQARLTVVARNPAGPIPTRF